METIEKNNKEGKWYKYEQGGDYYPEGYPDEAYHWYKAVESEENLKDGDIYIYRVKGFLVKKDPKTGKALDFDIHYFNEIFIKMHGQTKVSEIKWKGHDLSIGDDLLDILEKKLEEFDNKSDFDRKIHDMRLLNLVSRKTNENIPLTVGELRFLYEIDSKVEMIDDGKDYRIANIIAKRKSVAEDMNRIYDFKRINEYLDDLNLDVVKDPTDLKLPEVTGSLSLRGLKKTSGLKLPKIVKGNLTVAGVTESSHVVFPKIVEGDLSIYTVIIPYEIPPLSELEIREPTQISVVSASQLTLPEEVKGELSISVTIKDFEYLKLPKVGGRLSIHCPKKATGLILPKVTNGLSLEYLTSASGVLFPEINKDRLYLLELKDTNGLILPKNMKGRILCNLDIPDSCFMKDKDYIEYRRTMIDKLKATKKNCKRYSPLKDEIAFSVDKCKKKEKSIRILKADDNLNDVLENGNLNVSPENVNLKEKTYISNFAFKSNVVGKFNFSVSAKKITLSGEVRGNADLSNLTKIEELELGTIKPPKKVSKIKKLVKHYFYSMSSKIDNHKN